MSAKTPITVAYGDGIGPEIMAATLSILEAAGARLEPEMIEIGEKVYQRGQHRRDRGRLLGVASAHQGLPEGADHDPAGGRLQEPERHDAQDPRSLRQRASVRLLSPVRRDQAPGHGRRDRARERGGPLRRASNTGSPTRSIECLKLITRPGSEKIVRYAFEYARRNGRKKVTCFTKDNIMKLTDGLFHRVFDEIGAQYPDIEKEHWIVDIGAAKLADTPEAFDVIVMPNLYGDILSDVAAQIAGSVGLAGSANIGSACAMFEAIHGSAPRRAGQNLANPSGLLLGGRDDARAHRPDRHRRASPQRVAHDPRGRRPHVRHLQGGREHGRRSARRSSRRRSSNAWGERPRSSSP